MKNLISKKKKEKIIEQLKAFKKNNRLEEIKSYGKAINYSKVIESKKVYNRKKNKAEE